MRVWPVISNYWDRWGVQHTAVDYIFDSYEKAKTHVERIPCLNKNKITDNSTLFRMSLKVDSKKVIEYYIPKEGMEVQ